MSEFLRIQKQIRDNAIDTRNFIDDLNSWTTDISKKEQDLLAHKLQLTKTGTSTAGRTTSSAKSATPVPAPTYIIRKPDAKGNEGKQETEPGQDPEDIRQAEYDENKTLGNRAFQNGEYLKAISHYTRCLEVRPKDPVALGNRAQAYLNCDKPIEAEADCNEALSVAPDTVKVLYRRAVARKLLGRYAEASIDVDRVLLLDSRNRLAANLRSELTQLNAQQREKELKALSAAAMKAAVYEPVISTSARVEERYDAEDLMLLRKQSGSGSSQQAQEEQWIDVPVNYVLGLE